MISLGTGRYRPTGDPEPSVGLRDIIDKMVQSATDTEGKRRIRPKFGLTELGRVFFSEYLEHKCTFHCPQISETVCNQAFITMFIDQGISRESKD